MGSKFIVELEDDIFKNSSDENLFRAKGFKSLVFDEDGLNKLSENGNIEDMIEESYKNGYVEGYSNGIKENDSKQDSSISTDVHEIWEAIKRILIPKNRGCENSLQDVAYQIFSNGSSGWQIRNIFTDLTPEEVISKIRDYDRENSEEKHVKDDIKVGDEVFIGGSDKKGIVFAVEDDVVRGYLYPVQALQPIPFNFQNKERLESEKSVLTGRSFPQLIEIINSLETQSR